RGHVQEPGGLRVLRLPQEPRRRLRPPRLPVDLAQGALRARVLLRPLQQLADGLLPAPRLHQRRPPARGPRAEPQRERQRRRLHGGEGRGWVIPPLPPFGDPPPRTRGPREACFAGWG